MIIFYEDIKTFLQIKQQELILSPINLANSVQQRSRTESTRNHTTLNQRPGRDYRTSTGQEMLEEISIRDKKKLPKWHILRTGISSVSHTLTLLEVPPTESFSLLLCLSGIAENCHLKSQILPNFATKIAKFCHKKLPNLPHFAIKIAKFCKLSLLIASLCFVPEGQEYYIHLKMHTKSHSGAYQKEE